jgi:hypothetical protein
MQGDCSKDLTLPGNFPFGSMESIPFRSKTEVQKLFESHRHMAASYLESYIALYACTQLFDIPKFQEQVHQFWQTPEKFDIGWLAQYLAILGLGASATCVEDKTATELFFASEACLAQTPFMYRSTLANIRTLVLLVQAKQLCYATCWALDASWNIVGLIVRLSIMMGSRARRTAQYLRREGAAQTPLECSRQIGHPNVSRHRTGFSSAGRCFPSQRT